MNRDGIEIVPKYEVKYPKYEVVTPHSGYTYTIRSLKVSEEEALKSSLLTPTELTGHLNEILWSVLINKPEEIKTFSDFLNKNTPRDRDALMYGLYHVTYKDVHNYDVSCMECNTINSVKVKFGDSFSMIQWKGDTPILEKEIEVPLNSIDNCSAIVKQPSLAMEKKLLDDLKFSKAEDRDKQIDLLSVDRFEFDIKENIKGKKDGIVDRSNIKKIWDDLLPEDRRTIEKVYADNFGKYGVQLKTTVICQRCQHENETEIDLVSQFFRSVYE